jgi:hypothetical protein
MNRHLKRIIQEYIDHELPFIDELLISTISILRVIDTFQYYDKYYIDTEEFLFRKTDIMEKRKYTRLYGCCWIINI